MSSLKELRIRIKTVQAIRKITAAMKMVAAAKLRRNQDRLHNASPYAMHMQTALNVLLQQNHDLDTNNPFVYAKEGMHLILVITPDRGLCGNYHNMIVREVKSYVKLLKNEGKNFRLVLLGKRGNEALSRFFPDKVLSLNTDNISIDKPTFKAAKDIAKQLIGLIECGDASSVTAISGRFRNVLMQMVKHYPLIPFKKEDLEDVPTDTICEPKAEILISNLLEHNLCVQLNLILLENAACEQAARMTAMDNATRNAKDMIDGLQLSYNRTRQAKITTELIEIVSGAQGVA